jgi:rubrerythrin
MTMVGAAHSSAAILERATTPAAAEQPPAATPLAPDARVDTAASRADLVALLQLAYSGELAAAHAYRGHARSVRDPEERRRIEEIEREEWHHRELVGRMLAELGAGPNRARELRAGVIGRVLAALCHLGGWLAPMYGAGRLESRNVGEYESAARLARDAGRGQWVDCLLTMAEVEWEHEQYFRARVLSHHLGRCLPIWPAPQPKEAIRAAHRG